MSIQLKKYRHDRAVLIAMQRRWRAKNLSRVERSRYLATRKAIVTLQAVARGTAVRRRIQLWHACATRIIAQWNGYQQRKAYLRIRNSVTIIQTYYRATQSMRRERDQYQEQRRSAIVLQSYFRVLKAKRVAQRERAARLIQATYRMHEAQRKYQTLKRSAVTIQAAFRGHRCRDRHLRILRAVGILQKHLRALLVGCRVREDLARRQKAAVAIQSYYRGCACRREYLSKREASMKIQTWYRCQRESGLYRRLKSATVVLQRSWRSNRAMRAEIKKYHMTRGAIITVQAQVRCYLLRGRYLRLQKSALVLQKSWRGHKVRRDYRNRCNAATCLQQRWRARIEGRQERSAYLALKEQVVIIQSIYKARQCRRHFLQQRKAATMIESWVRGYRSRQRYRVLRSATVTIQRYWRAKRLTDDCRESYLKMKSQVVLVQSLYRGRQCRKDYLRKQSAVVLVQAWVRGHRCRQRYVKVKEAAATIQMHWTARKLAINRRSEFVSMRKSAVSIQSAYRAHWCRQLFLRKKISATVIQAWYRGQKSLRHFRTTRSAAVVIQRWYRNILLARRIKQEYEQMSTAAVIVQSFWRGHLARKRAELLRWEIAVAKEKMDALVKIQRWTQSRLQRLRYLRLCRATLIAQRLYKKRYQRRTEASVIMQSYVRMWLAKKMVRDQQRAALTIQSIWRGRKVRKANKNKKVAKARVRCLKATKAATEDKKLCNRTTSALHFLLTYKHLHQIVEAVSSLEVATRLSSRCCERLVAGQAVPVLFCLIRNCNRSLPCMEVIKHVVATLTNLAKYHVTAPAVLDCTDSVTGILDLMMIYRETNTLIATKATMLLTVLAQDNNLKLVIVTTPKVDEKLCSLLHSKRGNRS
ncbi:putative abnormal spindle-like microcephaly-associated protein-like [Apostichopus japonicus]|uniref:Putative abnormal spindle-like microcephaly-associated protein-like n=1 Tax=Stichopus japonicus TaxID=307972 RepID=A0A2G8K6L2_STIJA|nr:putative abnormal spindle-like microcephaly-associated protein-like [Apostichopus japonicus]